MPKPGPEFDRVFRQYRREYPHLTDAEIGIKVAADFESGQLPRLSVEMASGWIAGSQMTATRPKIEVIG